MNPIGLGIVGGVLGFGVGFLTRPSLMGVKLPMALLTSNVPFDAPFKEELMAHMAVAVVVGCVAGVVLGVILSRTRKA